MNAEALFTEDRPPGVRHRQLRAGAERRGIEVDEQQLEAGAKAVEEQIESESDAFVSSGELWDDAMIDPRDTRTALGIALSACHGNEVEISSVLRAMGVAAEYTQGTIRLSLGRATTEEEIDAVVAQIAEAVARLRRG